MGSDRPLAIERIKLRSRPAHLDKAPAATPEQRRAFVTGVLAEHGREGDWIVMAHLCNRMGRGHRFDFRKAGAILGMAPGKVAGMLAVGELGEERDASDVALDEVAVFWAAALDGRARHARGETSGLRVDRRSLLRW